jgi:hypothetical protein
MYSCKPAIQVWNYLSLYAWPNGNTAKKSCWWIKWYKWRPASFIIRYSNGIH